MKAMFDYERLHRDHEEARRAGEMAERKQREIARERANLAGLELDLAVLKLERLLRRKYRPDQPRVPAGSSDGGQWTEGSQVVALAQDQDANSDAPIILAGGFTREQLNSTVREFAEQNCEGRIHRELPGQFYGSTIAEVMAEAKSGNSAARKCIKILREDRFRK